VKEIAIVNGKDRARLSRVCLLMGKIPFPQIGGSKTPSVLGAMEFGDDMRGGISAYQAVLNGMLLEGLPELEEGWDYHDPDFVMDTFEEWVAIREGQGWHDAARNPFGEFLRGKRRQQGK
jgi:hypothetical protein